jgi:hypothetical protein
MEGQNQTSAETKRKGGFFARMTAVTLALAVIAASSVVLVVALLATVLNPFGSETIDRSGPTVLQQIRKLEEFTAAEGTFTQDVDLEEDAKYLPDFLSGQRVTALVTGSVRASVDFSQLDEDAIEVSDDGNRGLIDRADDFFSENPTDDQPLYAAAEEKVAAAARESDLVEEARTNTEQWLTTFLGAAGFETVEVTWRDSPA